jgi:hypothetical protein
MLSLAVDMLWFAAGSLADRPVYIRLIIPVEDYPAAVHKPL